MPAAQRPLLSDDAASELGAAALIAAPGPDVAAAVLPADRYLEIEVHRWRFGGRAS